MATATAIRHAVARRFRRDARRVLRAGQSAGRLRHQGHRRRHRKGRRRHRRRPEDRRPRRAARIRRPGPAGEHQGRRQVEVYLERVENALGEAVLSRDKARREESWGKLEKAFKQQREGPRASSSTRSRAASPSISTAPWRSCRARQVDIRPIRDVAPLMNSPQPFQILKMDRRRGNIVVSRRTVLEETRAEQRQELVQNLEEGQVIDGVVKNITDYGAFVDLGGIDGLLHVTDIAWRRVNHPTEVLNIGQQVKVKIIKINHETHRISLGMKQLLDDPWQGIEAKYPVGARFKGRVTNITDYGAFVELEPGIEGLIHVSEMSWTKKNVHPGKIVSTSQEVEVQILEVDPVKRRISLGLKQTMRNPWEVFVEKYPPGSIVEGEVKNKTEFGLFLGLDGDVDGMVHLSDLDWKRPGEQVIEEYKKGDMVKAAGARRRRREGAHLARHQAARRRSVAPSRRRRQEGRRRHLRGDRGEGRRPRREDRRHRPRPPSSSAPSSRATAATSAPSVSPSARRSMPASPSSTAAPARCRSRSRRSKWPRRRRRSPSTAPPIPARRSATFSAPRSSARPRSQPRRRNRRPSPSSAGLAARAADPTGSAAARASLRADVASVATIAAGSCAPLTMAADGGTVRSH